jgi:hypothetical protein
MIHLIEADKLEIVSPVHAGNGDLLGNAKLTFRRNDDRSITLLPPGIPAGITISTHDAGYLAAWLVATA